MTDRVVLLRGDRLVLCMPRVEMLPEYHRWENDFSTIMVYGNQLPQPGSAGVATRSPDLRGRRRPAR